ncbi:MAG TPA: XRE family transcriptional regulator [Blastocatellia bacterium]|nr:XRE family transcriptional regulator [Blastocatellia bacterium]
MAKETSKHRDRSGTRPFKGQSLAELLSNTRAVKRLTLRDVQEATNDEVSNAYLSQLETGRISRPSPNVLSALARVYALPYELLMERAGYIAPSPAGSELRSASPRSQGGTLRFANETLTNEEQEKLLEYLAFLRSKRPTRK